MSETVAWMLVVVLGLALRSEYRRAEWWSDEWLAEYKACRDRTV